MVQLQGISKLNPKNESLPFYCFLYFCQTKTKLWGNFISILKSYKKKIFKLTYILLKSIIVIFILFLDLEKFPKYNFDKKC